MHFILMCQTLYRIKTPCLCAFQMTIGTGGSGESEDFGCGDGHGETVGHEILASRFV